MSSIASILFERNIGLDGTGTPLQQAFSRRNLTAAIAQAYPAFEDARDALLTRRSVRSLNAAAFQFFHKHLQAIELTGSARKYLTGGWLEEYVALAAEAAGADEIRIGQRLAWSAGPYKGANEIDVIARFGQQLIFCSCKALSSIYCPQKQGCKDQLMSALNEVDNLVDHFGSQSDSSILIISTDLLDDVSGTPRYEQLFGKAVALNVSLITLDSLDFTRMINTFSDHQKNHQRA